MIFYVPLFPFYPAIVLILHLIDIRFNAKCFLNYYKKPLPEFETTIKFWLYILHVISVISVVVNAFILGFILPLASLIVFSFNERKNDLSSFLTFALSEYPIKTLYNGSIPYNVPASLKTCYYVGFRYPKRHWAQYQVSKRHYIVQSMQWAIVLLVIVFVRIITSIITWIMPNIPTAVRENIAKENLQIGECIHIETLARKGIFINFLIIKTDVQIYIFPAVLGDKEALKRLAKKKLTFVDDESDTKPFKRRGRLQLE